MKTNTLTYLGLASAIALSAIACKQETTIIERELIQSPAQDDRPLPQDNRPIYTVEGVVNGGGGKGVLCQKDGQPHLEVLDIHEGRYVYQLEFPEFESVEDASEYYAKRDSIMDPSDSSIEDELSMADAVLIDIFRFLPEGHRLKDTQDSHEAFVNPDCTIVQIAVFYNEELALVDTDLWNMLSPLNQYALLVHELWYEYRRLVHGDENSIATRRYVAHNLSKNRVRNIDDFTFKKAHMDCQPVIDPREADKLLWAELRFALLDDEENPNKTLVVASELNNKPLEYLYIGRIDQALTDILDGPALGGAYSQLKKETYPSRGASLNLTRVPAPSPGDLGVWFEVHFLSRTVFGVKDLELTVRCSAYSARN